MPRSTWYYNLKVSRLPDKHAALKGQIIKIYNHHKGRYGYRRILLSLRKLGYQINHKTVQRLMSESSIRAIIRVRKIQNIQRFARETSSKCDESRIRSHFVE
ncbi:IS3 family transposase [Kosakonia sp. S42]|uniref:IS3 family transposase n=1 Tax=Kosakonia sp. S42 TaxID=2767458 RepID=UPI0035C876DB